MGGFIGVPAQITAEATALDLEAQKDADDGQEKERSEGARCGGRRGGEHDWPIPMEVESVNSRLMEPDAEWGIH